MFFEFWFPLREVDIMFGVRSEIGDGNIDTLNCCILFAKFYIYQTKRNGDRILFLKFLHMLKNRIEVFEAMYISQNKYEQFLIKWSELYNNLWSSVSVMWHNVHMKWLVLMNIIYVKVIICWLWLTCLCTVFQMNCAMIRFVFQLTSGDSEYVYVYVDCMWFCETQ